MNKHIITSLIILNINNLYCADEIIFEKKHVGIFYGKENVLYLNTEPIKLKKNEKITIEDLESVSFQKVTGTNFNDSFVNGEIYTKYNEEVIDELFYFEGENAKKAANNKISDSSTSIYVTVKDRKVYNNIEISLNGGEIFFTFNLKDESFKKNDIKTNNEEEFLKSLKNVFGKVEDKNSKKQLKDIENFEKDYVISLKDLFNNNDDLVKYVKNNEITEEGLNFIKKSLNDKIFELKLYRFEYKINNIELSDTFKYKKIKDEDKLIGEIEKLLNKEKKRISLDYIQNLIKNSSDENLKKTEIESDSEMLELKDEINLEITKIDDSFLEDKKATIKFEIDESKKDNLKISDGKKDIEITFNDTINEDTKIVDYITTTLKLDKTKYKVVKGTNPIAANDKFVDSETYTILFTDKVEGYVEELKEDDIQISVEFKVNDSTKLKLNESNKTCDIVLNKDNCGITDFFNKLNLKYNGIKDNGVVLSIKEDGNNTELLNNNTYKCEKNKKYIIILGKKINNLVEEKITETPKKDKDKGEKKKDKEINNTDLNKDDNNENKKKCKCCCKK